MSETKLVVVIGVTGNQGGSVADRFLQDPAWKVRGITRNASSSAAEALKAKGIDIVSANLDDADSLVKVFEGANLIFSVTNYWEPFFRPDCRMKAAELGIPVRQYAGHVEEQQGKNIADAASQISTLLPTGFIASTLSHAGKCSEGRYQELYHFDAKANVFPHYVNEKHPELAKKLSCVQTGYFTSSYKLAIGAYFGKTDEGYQMSLPSDGDFPIPHLFVQHDMGPFVYAVSQLPPQTPQETSFMAAGTQCSWKEYLQTFTAVTGKQTKYNRVPIEEFTASTPDKDFGEEAGDMFLYSTDPGYDGGEKNGGRILGAKDIEEMGVKCPMTTLEEWMKTEDFTPIFSQ